MGALAVGALAPRPTPASAAPGAAYELVGKKADRVPVRVATYNVRADVPYDQARGAVHRLLPRADVVGLQEFYSSFRTPILAGLGEAGWGYWKPYGGDPVLFDEEKFTFLSGRAVEISPVSVVEDPQAQFAPREVRDSYATVVRLWHIPSGRRVTVVNAHLIPRATKDGRPAPGVPARVRVYKQEVAAVAAVVAQERRTATVYAVGDWNIHYGWDARERVKAFPVRRFEGVGFESAWRTRKPQRATFGERGVIDGVWARRAPVGARVLDGFPESDHRPVVVRHRLRVTGDAPPRAETPDSRDEGGEEKDEDEPTTGGTGSDCLLWVLC